MVIKKPEVSPIESDLICIRKIVPLALPYQRTEPSKKPEENIIKTLSRKLKPKKQPKPQEYNKTSNYLYRATIPRQDPIEDTEEFSKICHKGNTHKCLVHSGSIGISKNKKNVANHYGTTRKFKRLASGGEPLCYDRTPCKHNHCVCTNRLPTLKELQQLYDTPCHSVQHVQKKKLHENKLIEQRTRISHQYQNEVHEKHKVRKDPEIPKLYDRFSSSMNYNQKRKYSQNKTLEHKMRKTHQFQNESKGHGQYFDQSDQEVDECSQCNRAEVNKRSIRMQSPEGFIGDHLGKSIFPCRKVSKGSSSESTKCNCSDCEENIKVTKHVFHFPSNQYPAPSPPKAQVMSPKEKICICDNLQVESSKALHQSPTKEAKLPEKKQFDVIGHQMWQLVDPKGMPLPIGISFDMDQNLKTWLKVDQKCDQKENQINELPSFDPYQKTDAFTCPISGRVIKLEPHVNRLKPRLKQEVFKFNDALFCNEIKEHKIKDKIGEIKHTGSEEKQPVPKKQKGKLVAMSPELMRSRSCVEFGTIEPKNICQSKMLILKITQLLEALKQEEKVHVNLGKVECGSKSICNLYTSMHPNSSESDYECLC